MQKLVCVTLLAWLVSLFLRSRRDAGVAVGVVWSTFAFEQLLQQAFPSLWRHSYVVNAGIAAFVAFAAFGTVARGRIRSTHLPIEFVALLLLILLCALSTFWSVAPGTTVRYLTVVAPYVFVFVVITPLCVLDERAISSTVHVTAYFGGLIILGFLFADFGSRGVLMAGVKNSREVGNPLALASYAAMVTIAAIFLAVANRQNHRKRLLLICIAMAATFVVMRTLSRGQLLALLASLAIWIPLTNSVALKKSMAIPVILVAVLAVASFIGLHYASLHHRWDERFISEAGGDRLRLISSLLRVYANSDALTWIVGLGNSSSYRIIDSYPHNVPVEVLAEEGLLGFSLLAFFFGSVYVSLYRVMRAAQIPQAARFNIGFLAAVFCFYCLLSLKEGSLIGSHYLFSTGACIAWVIPRYETYAQTTTKRVTPVRV